jgi:hypothetical protein
MPKKKPKARTSAARDDGAGRSRRERRKSEKYVDGTCEHGRQRRDCERCAKKNNDARPEREEETRSESAPRSNETDEKKRVQTTMGKVRGRSPLRRPSSLSPPRATSDELGYLRAQDFLSALRVRGGVAKKPRGSESKKPGASMMWREKELEDLNEIDRIAKNVARDAVKRIEKYGRKLPKVEWRYGDFCKSLNRLREHLDDEFQTLTYEDEDGETGYVALDVANALRGVAFSLLVRSERAATRREIEALEEELKKQREERERRSSANALSDIERKIESGKTSVESVRELLRNLEKERRKRRTTKTTS